MAINGENKAKMGGREAPALYILYIQELINMSKLIQLKLSKEKLGKYDKLVNMLGLTGTFGEYQKAIDFGIDLAILKIKEAERVLPSLSEAKMPLFLASVMKLRENENKQNLIRKIAKNSKRDCFKF